MIRKFIDYFSHNKYRLTMFTLLAGATIFSVIVWRVRSDYSGSGHYFFLIWNLFLAWIPLGIWLFIDLFLIPGIARDYNMKLADRFAFD